MHDCVTSFRFFHNHSTCDELAAKALGRGLRVPAPLRSGEHFIANHEFAHPSQNEAEADKNAVHVPLCMRLTIGGPCLNSSGESKPSARLIGIV